MPLKFTKRALSTREMVGELMKNKRLELGLNVKDVERQTRIRALYIEAIERGDFKHAPSEAYMRGIVKNYAEFLKLPVDKVLTQYKRERELDSPVRAEHRVPKTPASTPRIVVTPRTVAYAGFALTGVSVVFYLIYQLFGFLGAPRLDITSPVEEEITITKQDSVTISGKTDPGNEVYINDYLVHSGELGEFSETVTLKEGVNFIEIAAVNKLGKKSTKVRKVIARLERADLPTFDEVTRSGIDVTVKIGASRSWVEIYLDDAPVYGGRGSIFEPGVVKSFHANRKIEIKVGNAGTVGVVITNEKVKDKEINPIGTTGQVMSVVYTFDQEF